MLVRFPKYSFVGGGRERGINCKINSQFVSFVDEDDTEFSRTDESSAELSGMSDANVTLALVLILSIVEALLFERSILSSSFANE